MPFDIGFSELLVIGIVALIVVGPRDLPGMFRTLGRFTAKLRSMAREFSRAMEDAADEAGVKDVGKDLRAMANPKKMGLDKLNEAASNFEKWEPGKKRDETVKDGAETGVADSKTAKRGPQTAKMTEERREKAEKIRKAAAERATARREAERAAEAETRDEKPDPAA